MKNDPFEIKSRGSNVRTEIIAGLTTFATMAYILIVQSSMMGDAGMNATGVMLAVGLISGLVTIAMGLYSKTPFALAPGMGTNAVLAYTMVAGGICTWNTGLGMIFISGCAFVLLSVFNVREKVVQIIPKALKVGIGAGVGAFLIRMSVINAGFISADANSFSLVSDFSDPTILLAAIGLVITLFLYFIRIKIKGREYQIRGSLLISIFLTTIIGIFMGVVTLPDSIFTGFSGFSALGDVAFKLDILGAFNPKYFAFILIFFMGDFFSTLGTALGVGGKAEMLDEDGNLPMIGKVFLVDACGTVLGSLFGLTTVTTYVESASGVEAGGRTGLTAVTTGLLFILSMFFAPLFLMVPTAATAPALIAIGISMMQTLKNVDFEDVEWYPVCIMIIVSLFVGTAKAIGIGMVAYCLVHYAKFLFSDHDKKQLPSIWTLVLTVLCCLQFVIK